MKLLGVVLVVCSCWLALLVQPQHCIELSKETTVKGGSINVADNHHHFTSSLFSVVDSSVEESKVNIIGFSGLCVSVKNGDYHNGNSIILKECKDGKENQLWTVRSSDQTIRSGGKCMTTYGYRRGNYVMIYNCDTAVNAATKWKIDNDLRKIINPVSGLALTAEKDAEGVYHLIVDYIRYVPRQAWIPTNATKPPVTKIVGYGSSCLALGGVQSVQMAKCAENVTNQRWAVYPDYTIRPEQNQGRCLGFQYGRYVVSVGNCGGWTNEPWVFQDDGSLLHVATGKVLDIKATPGSSNHFSPFLNCYDGRVSQIWSMTMSWLGRA